MPYARRIQRSYRRRPVRRSYNRRVSYVQRPVAMRRYARRRTMRRR